MKRRKVVCDLHHRQSRHQNGTNDPENLVKVLKTHHVAFHTLFFSGEPHRVAKILNDVWLDKRYKLVVVLRNEQSDYQGEVLA